MPLPSALLTPFQLETARKSQQTLSSGIPLLDCIIQGFPRGAMTEIVGPESSGRATLVHSLLTSATTNFEVCAYVDTTDGFDPHSAAASGVVLEQMVWIRCRHHLENALRSADLLLHAGGFGVVVLDVSQVHERALQRIPISYWHRFRLAVENTPTILTILEREAQAKSCAGMILELTRKQTEWSGAPRFHLLRNVGIETVCRKPLRPVATQFQARTS